jgi:type I restriction enzyme S subunit
VAEIETQLSRLDAAVAALGRARANLRRYRTAVLAAAFSNQLAQASCQPIPTDTTAIWPVVPLESLVEILDSKRVPLNLQERAKRPGSVPYYGATGVVDRIDGHLFDETLVLLGEDGAPFLDPKKPKAYMISDKSWVNNHAHVLRARPGVDSRFLMHQLNVVDYHPYISGTTRLKLPQGPLRQIPMVLPSIDVQTAIVMELDRRLSVVEAAEASIAANLKRAERLRQAVLRKAFGGELLAQDPADEPAAVLLARIQAERAVSADKTRGRGKRTKRVERSSEVQSVLL